MCSLRTNLSCLAVLAGIAAVSIAAGSGSAFAAKACSGGPVCGMKADGPKTYDSACAARADGTNVTHLGSCVIFCLGFGPTLIPAPLCVRGSIPHSGAVISVGPKPWQNITQLPRCVTFVPSALAAQALS